MFRMVTDSYGNQTLLEGQVVADAWHVYIKRANGHSELSFKNQIVWSESETAPCDYVPHDAKYTDANRAIELEERREKQREKNAQRAKTQCRWVIKSQNLDELLTLTYRENQIDRDLCKKHFKEWVRRMKAALGGEFVYCASFEKQARGAMHVHVACKKLPKHGLRGGVKVLAWKLGTQIWRSIIGENNGLCFVGGKTRFGANRRNLSQAKLAAYVSKYIMKDYKEAPLETNRYSRSNGLVLPKAVKMSFSGLSLAEMVEMAFHCADGDVIVSHSVKKDEYGGGRYWLVTEPDLRTRTR